MVGPRQWQTFVSWIRRVFVTPSGNLADPVVCAVDIDRPRAAKETCRGLRRAEQAATTPPASIESRDRFLQFSSAHSHFARARDPSGRCASLERLQGGFGMHHRTAIGAIMLVTVLGMT